MTNDHWAMLDNIESNLTKTFGEIIYDENEGFYDENLNYFISFEEKVMIN